MQQTQIDPNTTPSSMPPFDLPGLPGYVVCVSAHCQHDRMIAIHIYMIISRRMHNILSPRSVSVPFGCSTKGHVCTLSASMYLSRNEGLQYGHDWPLGKCCHAPCICTPCCVHMHDRVRAWSLSLPLCLPLPACPLHRFLALPCFCCSARGALCVCGMAPWKTLKK